MIINLTAPEVHPPQRIEMFDNDIAGQQIAFLTGLRADGTTLLLASWRQGEDDASFFHDNATVWSWYLGWAFHDIAEEAARVEASLLTDNNPGDTRDMIEPHSVLDH